MVDRRDIREGWPLRTYECTDRDFCIQRRIVGLVENVVRALICRDTTAFCKNPDCEYGKIARYTDKRAKDNPEFSLCCIRGCIGIVIILSGNATKPIRTSPRICRCIAIWCCHIVRTCRWRSRTISSDREVDFISVVIERILECRKALNRVLKLGPSAFRGIE